MDRSDRNSGALRHIDDKTAGMTEGKPKVVHLTSVHPALDGRIFQKECRSLAEAGYRVTLIAPHEKDEELDGVTIHAVARPRSRLARVTRTTTAILRAAVGQQADIYHLHDPELLPVGLLLRLRGKRVVYDAHEDLSRQMEHKRWIPRWLRPLAACGAGLIEKALARAVDGLVAATPVIARRFPAKKTRLLRNFPPRPVEPPVPYGGRPPVIVYAGAGISLERGAREIVRAIGRVPDRFNARLQLIGRIDDAGLHRQLIGMDGWSRVDWLGWRPPAEIPALLGRARVGLCLLHGQRNYREALPTKMYEYMAAGLPIVASSFSEWREVYGPIGCTLFVDPQDADQIAEAITWLLQHADEADAMGRRGRAAVAESLNWECEQRELLRLYSGLLQKAA